MVIDLKQVKLKRDIQDNALWVIEQVPTKVAAGDVTSMLRLGKTISVHEYANVLPNGQLTINILNKVRLDAT